MLNHLYLFVGIKTKIDARMESKAIGAKESEVLQRTVSATVY